MSWLPQKFRKSSTSTCKVGAPAKFTENGAAKETEKSSLSFDEYHLKVDYQKLEALEMDEFEEVVNEFQSVMSFEDEKKEAILSGKFAEANKEIITAFEVSSHEKAVCGRQCQ